MVVVDAMEKTAGVRVLQTELNDSPGVCLKLYGPLANIQMATRAAEETAHAMGTAVIAHVIPGPSPFSQPPMKPRSISARSSSSRPCSIRRKL